MNDVKKVIEEFKKQEELREEKQQRERDKYERQSEHNGRLFNKEIVPYIIRATIEEYMDWVRGYIENGGKPTHYYDYPFSQESFVIAKHNFTMMPRYGAKSINIIVPKGVYVMGKDIGHSNLYFMDGYRQVGGNVPIYEDMKF